MKRLLTQIIFPAAVMLILPIMGVYLAGLPINRYMEFPPETRYIRHAPFSWPVFAGYSLFAGAVITLLIAYGIRPRQNGDIKTDRRPFPWWGRLGIVSGTLFWLLAWTRFTGFEPFQPHTFTPLWLSFILVVNALTYRHKGRCIMLERPYFFISLFPASAAFWWFFEYLNRFVQNWHYTGVHFSPWEYFAYATLCFSTVLPAFISTYCWINGQTWFRKRYIHCRPVKCLASKKISAIVLLMACIGLALIGIWPDHLFALLWIAPLLIIASTQILRDEPPLPVKALLKGNWQPIVSSALAALFCGGFWEMWNYFSLARWEYSIPFVHRAKIFEMPVLGYAGYLPFGLECMVIIELFQKIKKQL